VIDSIPPSVVADGTGRSAPTMLLTVGIAAAPVEGPARKPLAAKLETVKLSDGVVPALLTEVVNNGLTVAWAEKLVTVPLPAPGNPVQVKCAGSEPIAGK